MSYFTRNLAEISAINEQMRVIKTGAHVVKRDTYVFMLKLKSVLIFYEYLNSFNGLLIFFLLRSLIMVGRKYLKEEQIRALTHVFFTSII